MYELLLLAETVRRECTFALWLNLATEASGGEALLEVRERAGTEFSVPGRVQTVGEVGCCERGGFRRVLWRGGGQ